MVVVVLGLTSRQGLQCVVVINGSGGNRPYLAPGPAVCGGNKW